MVRTNQIETASNSMTVNGLRRVMREAFEMKTVDDKTKAELALQRGLCYLIREIAVHDSTFAILDFARQVTVALLFDPIAGRDWMEELAGRTPSSVPPPYYALAADVFDYCARRLAKAERRIAKHGEQVVEPVAP